MKKRSKVINIYNISKVYNDEDKEKISTLLADHYDYISEEKKDFRDKILNRIFNEEKQKASDKDVYIKMYLKRIKSELKDNKTYYIKEEKTNELIGLVNVYKTNSVAIIDVFEVDIENETVMNNLLTTIINDLIKTWNLINISIKLRSYYSDKYNKAFTLNGFAGSYCDDNYAVFYKEVKERKYEGRKRKY